MATSQLPATDGSQDQRTRTRGDGDEAAVASFILGLLGLFFFNIVLGPLALVLATVSLVRGTGRRGRALTGLALGAADLVVLGILIATHSGGFTLQLGA